MPKSISLSTDVYAAIWAARQTGEDTEDEILRRILKVPANRPVSGPQLQQKQPKIGFRDPRFGIELPEGFEIFRVYKGVEHRAKAENGAWVMIGTGQRYPSLNQLSRAVSGNFENAWNNWYFRGSDGKRHRVTELRKMR